MADRWEEIAPSSDPQTIRMRRADPEHPLELFRGRDHQGNYLFLVRSEGGEWHGTEVPQLAMLEVSLERLDGEALTLTIRLKDRSQRDLFGALCADLMESTSVVGPGDERAGVAIVLERLSRWRELLRALREDLLSEARVVGLIGELLVLRDVFLPRCQPGDAVAAWRGPLGDEQDFIWGCALIEVKTQVASADSRVQIASERQLDTKSGWIWLCHQRLGVDAATEPEATTLNSLVHEISHVLSAADERAKHRFFQLLVEAGYERRAEYDQRRFVLARRVFFEVRDGFPSIVGGSVPEGVEEVRYALRLDSCEPFRVLEGEATERILAS